MNCFNFMWDKGPLLKGKKLLDDHHKSSTDSQDIPVLGCSEVQERKSNVNSSSRQKSKKESLLHSRSEGDILSCPNLKSFTFAELIEATRDFNPDTEIGEGGFGFVYKGWIDEQTGAPARGKSGKVVAIKKLKPDGFQGHKEWLSEVNYLGRLHHPNLVKLIGYCLDGDNRLLVYDYMPKGSLEDHLFDSGGEPLSWTTRMKVAMGAARGLSFLHDSEQQVIYRDFKASNVLLDSDFNPRLSDFGLAKAGPTGGRSHVSTQVLGTRGYAAPEYIATGRLTTKCDVYSFGVVLMELLTGRQVVDKTKVGVEQNLIEWVRPYLNDKRKLFRVMDTKLQGQYPQKGAFMVAFLALHCLGDAKVRPTMPEVVTILERVMSAKRTKSPNPSQVSESPSDGLLLDVPPPPPPRVQQ
ncbi:Probable serine/threonine-protein kinase PBL3 [Linum perenne]